MEGDWKEFKLGDVCSRLRSGKGIKAESVLDVGLFPVIGGNGIRGYTNVSNFKGECAIIGRQGAYCGNVRFYEGEAYMTEHAVVVVGNELADTRYLACLLSLMHLGNLSAQSAQPGLSVQTLSKLLIHLPSIEYQRRVSSIIKSLDDKIEVNRRINDNFTLSFLLLTCFVLWLLKLRNDNLLQQADALFKSWFVDFEPFKNGEFEESGLGFIPKGWNVYEFGRVLSPVNEKVGDRVVTEYSVGNTGIRSRSDIYHKAICSNPEKNRIIRRGNLVFGMGNDRVTWGIMKDEIGATSPAYPAYKIDESIDYIYFEFFFKHYYAQAKDLIRPSVRQGQTIDKGALMQKKIYVPSKIVWDRFLHIHNPIIETSRCVEIESDRLSELRDVLLPRLMSGEMKVSEMIA